MLLLLFFIIQWYKRGAAYIEVWCRVVCVRCQRQHHTHAIRWHIGHYNDRVRCEVNFSFLFFQHPLPNRNHLYRCIVYLYVCLFIHRDNHQTAFRITLVIGNQSLHFSLFRVWIHYAIRYLLSIYAKIIWFWWQGYE